MRFSHFGGRWRERWHSHRVSWLLVPVLRGVAPPLLLAPLMLGERPGILRAPTKLVRAIRLRSCQALTLSSHTIFGLGDLSGELTNPRRNPPPACPHGRRSRQESLAVG